LWRDQFLHNEGEVFEMSRATQQQSRLERVNGRLKAMVGKLIMELRSIDSLEIEGCPMKGRP
jgi:hypothetical protein